MGEQENRLVVQRGYEAFGRGDIETLLTLFADDIEWMTPGPPELATAGRRQGPGQVAQFFRAVGDVYEIQRFEPEAFIAEGDRVVVLGTETTRVKATGKVIEAHWAHAFTLRDGKVVGFRDYTDTAAVVDEIRAAQSRA